jgi:hypothetical protein
MMGMQRAKSTFRVIAVAVIFLIVLMLTYFSAYAVFGKRGTISGPVLNGEAQFFSYGWQAILFTPAAKIESLVRGKKVFVQQWDVER